LEEQSTYRGSILVRFKTTLVVTTSLKQIVTRSDLELHQFLVLPILRAIALKGERYHDARTQGTKID
jgi:hypothetical protein